MNATPSDSGRWRHRRQTSADEAEVVRRVLAGDREAFRLIVLRYQSTLAGLVFRHTGDAHACEDLVQETFLRAYRALGSFDPRYRLSTWLARIALNAARDHGRRRQVREATPVAHDVEPAAAPDPSTPTPAAQAATKELQHQVGAALAELPEPQREVIVLGVYGGYTQREVADVLELPLGTVKTRQRTALGKLRQLVAPQGGLA
ncbi:MAG: sigma-70 family RNA polymerase sigma factor [Planctomycetota bacterium]